MKTAESRAVKERCMINKKLPRTGFTSCRCFFVTVAMYVADLEGWHGLTVSFKAERIRVRAWMFEIYRILELKGALETTELTSLILSFLFGHTMITY